MLPLLRLFARLPLSFAHALGALLGLLSLLRPRLRHDIADNLREAGLYAPGRVRRVAMELGKGITELPAIWLSPLAEMTGWVREVRGWEHVEAALAKGKGLIVMGPHLGSLELAGIYLGTRIQLTALYTRPRQEWFHQMMREGRERCGGHTVEPNLAGVRALLTALKRNEAVWVLPDQRATKGEGIWAPFFGRWAYLPTLFYRLRAKSGAAAVLFCCERLPRGRGYRLTIEPLPELPDAGDAAVRVVNGALEDMVRRLPDQYLWNYRLHRVRKTDNPPEGAAR